MSVWGFGLIGFRVVRVKGFGFKVSPSIVA